MQLIRAFSILLVAVGPLVAAQPTAPTNLTATVAANCSSITLSWSAVTANPAVSSYRIYRNNICIFTNGLSTTFTDTNVSPIAYSYQVTAFNGKESPRSSTASVNPCADTTPPTVPPNVVVSAAACTEVSLAWGASADSGPAYQLKSGVAGYRVYRDGDFIAQVAATSFRHVGLDEGSTYVVSVSSVDTNGNESAPAVVSVTTPPAVPASVRIDLTNDVAVLRWSGTPGVPYQVESATNFFGPWSPVDGPTTNFAVTALAVDPTASYRVGRFAQISSYQANATNFRKDKSPPTTPGNLTAVAGNCSNVLLSWSASVDTGTRVGNTVYTSGLAGYLIYRTNGGGGFLKRVDAQTTNTTDSTVSPSLRYTYAVVALDNAGNQSAPSAPASVVTPGCSNSPTCTYSIVPTSWSAPAGGGSTSVSVTAGSGCSWTVSNPCGSWLTVTPTSGSGSGAVTLTATSNTTGSSRSCTVTIAGQSFTVTQPAVPVCTYAIAPTSWSAPAGGGSTSVSVTAGSGCSWTVSNPCSWLTVTPASGSGSGTVTVTATSNTTGSSRSCTVTMAGQSFVVTQVAGTCTYTITTSSSPSGGGTTSGGGTVNCGASVTVTATPATCYRFVSWTENGTVVSTAASYTFTASGNRNLVANFAVETFTITTSVSPAGGGTVSGGGTVACGASVTVTATPNSGYNFATWTENGTVVSTSASYSFFAGADRHLVANFSALLPPESWPKAFPGSSYNYGRAVAVDASGDVILAAMFAGTADFGTGPLSSAGESDMVLARYSPSGQCRWVRQYGATGTEAPKTMALDANGNIIVAGSFTGTADFGGGLFTSAGQEDIFLVKYTPSGEPIWAYRFGGSLADVANGVAVDANGNLVLVGTFKGNLSFGGSTLYSVALGMDTYVAKFAGSDGRHLWSKNFPNMADDQGQAVALDQNGNIFITGSFSSINFGGGGLNAVHGYDIYVAKLSPDGEHLWSRGVGGTGGDSGKSIAVDAAGNVFVTGWFTKSVDFGAGPATLLTNLTSFYDIFLAKLRGADGACLWAKSLSGPSYDNPVAVATDGNGNAYLTGFFPHELNLGTVKLVATGNQDVFVAKFSSTGDLLRAISYGGLTKGYSGDYVVAGGVRVGTGGQVYACGSFRGAAVFDGVSFASPDTYATWLHRVVLP